VRSSTTSDCDWARGPCGYDDVSGRGTPNGSAFLEALR